MLQRNMMMMAAALTLTLAGACGDDGGGGSNTPANTNSVSATVSGGAGGPTSLQGNQPQGTVNVFGAAVAGDVLNLWITASNGTTLTVIVQTTDHALPGTVAVGVPTQSDAWVTMTMVPMVYNTFEGSGTITVNHCPKLAGDGLTGRFNAVRLKSELDGAEVTLDGTFNLVTASVAGALNCQAPVEPGPDTVGGDTTTNPGVCDSATCDGPCCPFAECMTSCQLTCFSGCFMNPSSCLGCTTGCLDTCNVSADCRTAALALDACGTEAGCDPMAETDTCLETHCCTELKAAW